MGMFLLYTDKTERMDKEKKAEGLRLLERFSTRQPMLRTLELRMNLNYYTGSS